MAHAGRVDGVAGFEVVAAIEHHIGLGCQGVQQRGIGALLQGHQRREWVDACGTRLRRQHFGVAHCIAAMHDLALQVGEVHHIVIDHGQRADTGRRQVQDRRRGQSACADDQDAGCADALLALDADLVEQDMARIARQLVIAHAGVSLL